MLTDRQLQIAYKVAQGKRSKEIANELFIEDRTVQKHLRNIYSTLKINGRMELMKYVYNLEIDKLECESCQAKLRKLL